MVSYSRRSDYEDVDARARFGGSCVDGWRDDGVDYRRPSLSLHEVPPCEVIEVCRNTNP